ncbi:MAG: desampylase [Chloroflexota bacterium]
MLHIHQDYLAEILDHARAGAPGEVCGVLAGRDGHVTRVYRGQNIADNPRVRYEMDPRQQLDIMREVEENGEQMVAIYHSHPHSSAYPSRVDQSLAFYPDSVYIIVSLADSRPVVRAFRMVGKKIEEEEIMIDE